MRDNRNAEPVLDRCGDCHGAWPFAGNFLPDEAIGKFLEFNLIAVGGDVNIGWIEIEQVLDGMVNISCIVPFQRGKQFKRKNRFSR